MSPFPIGGIDRKVERDPPRQLFDLSELQRHMTQIEDAPNCCNYKVGATAQVGGGRVA